MKNIESLSIVSTLWHIKALSMRACVCACVRACMRACVRACVPAYVYVVLLVFTGLMRSRQEAR